MPRNGKTKYRRGRKISISVDKSDGVTARTKTVSSVGPRMSQPNTIKESTWYFEGGNPDSEELIENDPTRIDTINDTVDKKKEKKVRALKKALKVR